jgi:hypothetical protein
MTSYQELATTEWAVAEATPSGELSVAASRHGLTHDEAGLLADRADPVTITVVRSGESNQITAEGVNPLVYRRDPESPWIFASVGWSFTEVKTAAPANRGQE